MKATIRVFVAIQLPVTVKNALGSAIAEIGSFRGAHPVKPEGVHLTLKFLGDVDVERVGSLCEAIEAVAWSVAPFSLSLGGTGVFSESRAARVLWVGVTGQIELLQELRRDLESTTSALGFTKDRRGFSPHITLVRARPESPSEELNKTIEALSRLKFLDGLQIPVSHISLMRSTLRLKGASYDTLASFRLVG